jgi:hypothetical protein
MKAIDIALESFKHREKYILNYEKIAKKIKRVAIEFFKDKNVKVIVFGSVVKKTYTPLSDIDILIVSDKAKLTLEELATIRLKIKESLKDFSPPIEIHVANRERFERWYKKFLDFYKEID